MSDLLPGNVPPGASNPGRAQDAGSRTVTGARGASRLRTPTEVMADRRAREAKKEQEAAQRRMQEEGNRRKQPENVVGVVDDSRPISGRTPLAEIQPGTNPGSTSVTASRRRTENIPATNGGNPRTTAAAISSQSRPVPQQQQQQQYQQTQPPTPQPSATDQTAGQINKNRTEAYEKLSMPAVAGPKPSQPQNTSYPAAAAAAAAASAAATAAPPPPPPPQPAPRVGFPHAFERWETLSSHWEGLTSFWIRKLESNRDELSGKPIDQQMARQVIDLSAAGANLFHAVVELQRLRASSERKFQRWYFETRGEQEQTQERIADLERQLRHEREHGSSASVEAVRAEKKKSDDLVREMKRELQISKEEARRAWEELGRREQEERERTLALRSGEPTLIGGVQVVPMAGISSRHISSGSRPQTRGGPVPGGPGPTQLSGQQQPYEPAETFSRSQTTLESPQHEQTQFTYHPGPHSPAETDPFTETSRPSEPARPSRQQPDVQFYSSPPRSQQFSPAAAARSTVSPVRGQTPSTSPSRFYQGVSTSVAGYPPVTGVSSAQRPVTAGSDHRSYVPSTASGNGSEEEQYHINPDGSYTRDAQGRRIPSNQPISGPGVNEEEEDDEDDDEDDDYTAEVERERMYAQQYSQQQQAARAPNVGIPTTSAPVQYGMATIPTTQPQTSPSSRSHSSTISASSQPMLQPTSTMPSGYDRPGYVTARDDDIPSNVVTGWEAIQSAPRHHHPSRLSAISEEQSGRTSPSRMSYISETPHYGQRGGEVGSRSGNGNGNSGGSVSGFASR